MLLFFVVPTLLLFVYSFWRAHTFQLEPDLTLTNYTKALTTAIFYSVTWTGLKIGFITATISTAVSYPVAYYLVFRTRGNIVLYLVLVSWFMSYLVRVFAWRTILGSNGMVNSGLQALGLIDEPLSFLLFSPFAVVVTLVHIFLPFTLLLLVSALRDVKVEYLEAARIWAGMPPFSACCRPDSHRRVYFMFTCPRRRRLRHAAAGRRSPGHHHGGPPTSSS
jgi:spermidine/putrescine transport system permease protein